ncbi:MAG: hypothetical protein HYV26_20675 [Candidatus Hydrogenedentes bacterium]|nr:hypothetical protein [Candidatus Hydrogenedentota bacterium]
MCGVLGAGGGGSEAEVEGEFGGVLSDEEEGLEGQCGGALGEHCAEGGGVDLGIEEGIGRGARREMAAPLFAVFVVERLLGGGEHGGEGGFGICRHSACSLGELGGGEGVSPWPCGTARMALYL